jgi:hypothetical protein
VDISTDAIFSKPQHTKSNNPILHRTIGYSESGIIKDIDHTVNGFDCVSLKSFSSFNTTGFKPVLSTDHHPPANPEQLHTSIERENI